MTPEFVLDRAVQPDPLQHAIDEAWLRDAIPNGRWRPARRGCILRAVGGNASLLTLSD